MPDEVPEEDAANERRMKWLNEAVGELTRWARRAGESSALYGGTYYSREIEAAQVKIMKYAAHNPPPTPGALE